MKRDTQLTLKQNVVLRHCAVETLPPRVMLAAFATEQAAWRIDAPGYSLFAYDRPMFVADGKPASTRREYWRTDGTPGGTRQLTVAAGETVRDPFPDARAPDAQDSWNRYSVVRATSRLGGREVFVVEGSYYRQIPTKLWTTDGTLTGTKPLFSDAFVDPAGAGGSGWSISENAGYVIAPLRPGYPNIVWRTDGTEAGTRQLAYSIHAQSAVGLRGDTYVLRVRTDNSNLSEPWSGPVTGVDIARYVNSDGAPLLYDSVTLTQPVYYDYQQRPSLRVIGGHLVASVGRWTFQVDGSPANQFFNDGNATAELSSWVRVGSSARQDAVILRGMADTGVSYLFSDGSAAGTWTIPGTAIVDYTTSVREIAFDESYIYTLNSARRLTLIDRTSRRILGSETLRPPAAPAGFEVVGPGELGIRNGRPVVVWEFVRRNDPNDPFDRTYVNRAFERDAMGIWRNTGTSGIPTRLDAAGDHSDPTFGTLTARGFADLNGNGRRDVSEAWLDGTVTVRLANNPASLVSAEAGTAGIETIDAIPAGAYRAAFVPALRDTQPIIDALRPAALAERSVTIVGRATTAIEFPIRVMQPGTGKIDIDVFFDLVRDGRVDSPRVPGIDRDTGAAIDNWRYKLPAGMIYVDVQRYLNGKRVASTQLELDAGGKVSIDRLPAGRYFVRVNLSRFDSDGYAHPWSVTTRSSYWIDIAGTETSPKQASFGVWASRGASLLFKYYRDYNANGRADPGEPSSISTWWTAARIDPVTGQYRSLNDSREPPYHDYTGALPSMRLVPGRYVVQDSEAGAVSRVDLAANQDLVLTSYVPYARIEVRAFIDADGNGQQDADDREIDALQWLNINYIWNQYYGSRRGFYGGGPHVLEVGRPINDPAATLSADLYESDAQGNVFYYTASIQFPLRPGEFKRFVLPLVATST